MNGRFLKLKLYIFCKNLTNKLLSHYFRAVAAQLVEDEKPR